VYAWTRGARASSARGKFPLTSDVSVPSDEPEVSLVRRLCNVGNGEDGFEPARRTGDLSAIQFDGLKREY